MQTTGAHVVQGGLAALLLCVLLQACSAWLPLPQPYRPQSSREEVLLAKARRDLFPEDVRRRLEAYRNELVAWPGVVTLANREPGRQGRSWTLILAHHYWDWTEQPGRAGQRVLLSPRGEGFFQCSQPVADSTRPYDPRGELTIVYGYPEKVLDNEIIQLHCVHTRAFHPSTFSTNVLEYGRNYVLKQDAADLRLLQDR